jgi:UPF0716 family protein affecting phage T7 exclusion
MGTIDTVCVWVGRVALVLGAAWLLAFICASIFVGAVLGKAFRRYK